jgi:FKBP-type peptidyl-prolyl cis-trans isomerase FklB
MRTVSNSRKEIKMKLHWIIAFSLLIAAGRVTAQTAQTAQGASPLKDQKDKVSYSLGLNIGNNLKKQSIDVNPDLLVRGIKDSFSNAKPLLTEAEVEEVLTAFKKDMAAKQQQQIATLSEKNKKDGAAFLAANKTKEGVKTTASGLQYKVLKQGTGPKPKATDTVKTTYKGSLIDGSVFDSSDQHGGSATFPVNGVIKGWTEALQLMEVGSKWQIFVPAELAYGERGAGDVIGPNATLIFEVELLSIEPPKP